MSLFDALNVGTWFGWGNKAKDLVSGKPDYLGNAKNLLSSHLLTSQPKLTASVLVNLIDQYTDNPPNSVSASVTSAYYLYNALIILAKAIYIDLNNGTYNKYSISLSDSDSYKLTSPIDDNSESAKFFIFLFNEARKDVTGFSGKLNGLVGKLPASYSDQTQTNVSKYISDTFFPNDAPTTDFVKKYNEYKKTGNLPKKGMFWGGRRTRQGKGSSKGNKGKEKGKRYTHNNRSHRH